jgi:hypothetical protein
LAWTLGASRQTNYHSVVHSFFKTRRNDRAF